MAQDIIDHRLIGAIHVQAMGRERFLRDRPAEHVGDLWGVAQPGLGQPPRSQVGQAAEGEADRTAATEVLEER